MCVYTCEYMVGVESDRERTHLFLGQLLTGGTVKFPVHPAVNSPC